tara:strand:+ start:322 stop:690 length:369 start_codon:yes stop_codon:yes gene_type:complete
MSDKKPTCDDRIDAALSSRVSDFETYFSNHEVYENGNDELPSFHHYGLCFDAREDEETGEITHYDFLLSWGGPSDFVRFHRNGSISYHFQDWFDGAVRIVTGLDWAEELRSWFDEVGALSFG